MPVPMLTVNHLKEKKALEFSHIIYNRRVIGDALIHRQHETKNLRCPLTLERKYGQQSI